MTDSVSVVLISRTLEEARRASERLPPGADEVLLATNPRGIPSVHPAVMRNRGAEHATGSILAFFDDDCSIEGDLRWFKGRSEAWWTAQSFRDATGDGASARACAFSTAAARHGIWFGAIGAFMVFRRSAFWAVGGFPVVAPGEDTGIARRLYRLGLRMHPSPFRVTFHRPVTTLGPAIRRAPDWLRFPQPETVPILRQVPRQPSGTQQPSPVVSAK